MRMVEIRARYAVRVPRRGATLLLWRPDPSSATVREALYPTRAAALRAAYAQLQDPRCVDVWVYDGHRLYDRKALIRWTQEAETA